MPMYSVVSCVVGRTCLLWPVNSLGKTLLAFDYFILYSKAKLACYSRLSLDFLHLHSNPLWWKGHLSGVLALDMFTYIHFIENLYHKWVLNIVKFFFFCIFWDNGLPWWLRRQKNVPAMWKTWVWSLDWEDPLEEGMATHSSIPAWRIP